MGEIRDSQPLKVKFDEARRFQNSGLPPKSTNSFNMGHVGQSTTNFLHHVNQKSRVAPLTGLQSQDQFENGVASEPAGSMYAEASFIGKRQSEQFKQTKEM